MSAVANEAESELMGGNAMWQRMGKASTGGMQKDQISAMMSVGQRVQQPLINPKFKNLK